jgi:hypothetical protein
MVPLIRVCSRLRRANSTGDRANPAILKSKTSLKYLQKQVKISIRKFLRKFQEDLESLQSATKFADNLSKIPTREGIRKTLPYLMAIRRRSHSCAPPERNAKFPIHFFSSCTAFVGARIDPCGILA